MTLELDYARLYETEYRRRRRLQRAVARAVWAGLFLLRPRAALAMLREAAG